MRLRLEPAPRWPRFGRGPLLAALVWGLLIASLLALGLSHRVQACTFKRVTGVPCPTCGGTRCVESLAQGDVLGAVALNPLVFAGLVLGAAWLLFHVAFRRKVVLDASVAERRWLWGLFLLLVLVNWAYVIAYVG